MAAKPAAPPGGRELFRPAVERTSSIRGQSLGTLGFHASHEQFSPSHLLECVQLAEQAGFAAAMCSDHFHPWSSRQGESGFAWTWLGAALQATALSFGVVTVPGGWRYHPAVIAQAAATLAQMYPGRFWLAPGSGEWLNEHITGGRWPSKGERNVRLEAGVKIMRALWAGKTVTESSPIVVDEAILFTRPEAPPPVIGAALTPRTAEWLAGWADGLITVNQPSQKLAELISAFRSGGGEGKPIYLQAHHSFAESEEQARQEALEQWGTNVFDSSVLAELRTHAQFDAAAELVQPGDLEGSVRISADIERHIDWLHQDMDMGFTTVYLHQVGRNQRRFIEAFGEQVLPRLSPG